MPWRSAKTSRWAPSWKARGQTTTARIESRRLTTFRSYGPCLRRPAAAPCPVWGAPYWKLSVGAGRGERRRGAVGLGAQPQRRPRRRGRESGRCGTEHRERVEDVTQALQASPLHIWPLVAVGDAVETLLDLSGARKAEVRQVVLQRRPRHLGSETPRRSLPHERRPWRRRRIPEDHPEEASCPSHRWFWATTAFFVMPPDHPHVT